MAMEVARLHGDILLRISEGVYGAAAPALPPYALPTPRTWSAPATRRSSFDIADGVAVLDLGFAFGCGGGEDEEEEDDDVCGLAATAERAAWATLASPTPPRAADDDGDDDGWAMPGAAGPASDFEMMSSAAMGFSRDLEAELCGLRKLGHDGAASRVRRSASLGSAASFNGGVSSSFSTPSCSQGSSPTSVLAQSGAWDAAMDAARPRDAKAASHGKPSRDRRSVRPRAAAGGGGSAHSSSTVLPLRRTSSCRQDAVPSTGTGVFIPRSTQPADPALVQRKPATADGAEMTFKVIGNKGARSCARH
eukprot:SM000068S20591  [mRNA]  locus=s68:445664:446989:+ [translate_table: standard]